MVMQGEWQFVRVASLCDFIGVVEVGAQLTIYINVKLLSVLKPLPTTFKQTY